MKLFKTIIFTSVAYFFATLVLNAQKTPLEHFDEYTKDPREVVYTHLNKSVLVIGESLGFSSYVFDKSNKKLSNLTSNLYCVITDGNDNIVKSGLFLVENGISSGAFEVDSLFTSGNYTFKAFTNWMRNFDEPNYFSQALKIIDPEVEMQAGSKTISAQIDIQFLPEGGHMVSDTENTIGVIAKNDLGLGVSNISCELVDDTNLVINSFSLNDFGIGKFKFTPQEGKDYKIKITSSINEDAYILEKPKTNGIVMSLNDLGNRGVAISLKTNDKTLPSIKNKPYQLLVHNSFDRKIIDIKFDLETSITQLIPLENLFSGINIFTLFDENNQPLLERLFFNYDSIDITNAGEMSARNQMDSIAITLPIKQINPTKFNNFSISVLPSSTKSLPAQQNILSAIFLQPYLKGQIQNAAYYFTDIDRKKKFELDNLLLTQGWSSYDWHAIFNNTQKNLYEFEAGLSFTANVNSKKSNQFFVYPTNNNPANTVILSDSENSFALQNYYLYNDEKLRIGEIQKAGNINEPNIYIQFKPVAIPQFKTKYKTFPIPETVQFEFQESEVSFKSSWEQMEMLDEVVLTTSKQKTRIEKLKTSTFGKVEVLDESQRRQYTDFVSYISTKGFTVSQNLDTGELLIENPYSSTPTMRTPTIYLNGLLLSNFKILLNFNMNIVDYVIINKGGLGEGLNGGAGVIKIYTDPSLIFNKKQGFPYKEYSLPLTFQSKKRFYTPVYSSYTSDFFKEYGVIDWQPDLKVDSLGNLKFNIFNTKTSSINLYIEGTANDGSFISEIKTINL